VVINSVTKGLNQPHTSIRKCVNSVLVLTRHQHSTLVLYQYHRSLVRHGFSSFSPLPCSLLTKISMAPDLLFQTLSLGFDVESGCWSPDKLVHSNPWKFISVILKPGSLSKSPTQRPNGPLFGEMSLNENCLHSFSQKSTFSSILRLLGYRRRGPQLTGTLVKRLTNKPRLCEYREVPRFTGLPSIRMCSASEFRHHTHGIPRPPVQAAPESSLKQHLKRYQPYTY
jgi:hypothetical protein